MTADRVFAKQFAQLMRQSFGQSTRVDEDQCCPVRIDQFDDPRIDFGPLFVHANSPQIAGRYFDPQIQLSHMSDVENGGRIAVGSDKKAGNLVHRTLCGRQSDALQPGGTKGGKSFQSDCQMRPPLVAYERVNFVNDDGFHCSQDLATFGTCEHQIKRLGRRDKDMRRPLQHRCAFGCGSVAGPQSDPDRRNFQSHFCGKCKNLGQWLFEVAMHVIRKSAKGRDVDHPNFVRQVAPFRFLKQAIDRRQECGQCLAASRGCRNQDISAGNDIGPPLLLGLRRSGKPGTKPFPDDRMKQVERCRWFADRRFADSRHFGCGIPNSILAG